MGKFYATLIFTIFNTLCFSQEQMKDSLQSQDSIQPQEKIAALDLVKSEDQQEITFSDALKKHVMLLMPIMTLKEVKYFLIH
jgi:hypothetical protein